MRNAIIIVGGKYIKKNYEIQIKRRRKNIPGKY